LRWLVFCGWERRIVAVHCPSSGDENEFLEVAPRKYLEEIAQADEVNVGILPWVLERFWDALLRGEVENDFGLESSNRILRCGCADVYFGELRLRIQVLALTRTQVIEYVHFLTTRNEGIDEVRTNETGTASD